LGGKMGGKIALQAIQPASLVCSSLLKMPGLNPSARVCSPQFKFARAFLDKGFSLFLLPPQ